MSRKLERFLRKLERFCAIADDEKKILHEHTPETMQFTAGEDLIHERMPVEGAFIILSGFACRYKLLSDGRRQIVGLLLPGDICDMRVFLLNSMDHSIAALNTVTATLLSADAVMDILARFPRVTRALWWTTAVEDAITREWLVKVGSRTAFERVAHLFCEVFARLESVGLARNNMCELPLTQVDIADALALSSVHVNRTLMAMRKGNLVRVSSGQLELLNRSELEVVAGFDRTYLQLDGVSSRAARLSQFDTLRATA